MASNASVAIRTQSPSYQAYQILHMGFVVAPFVAGVDKFFHFLVNWDQYLSPLVTRTLPVSGDSSTAHDTPSYALRNEGLIDGPSLLL